MKSIRLTAEMIPEPEGGLSVYGPDPGICAQGDTETERLDNLCEAAQFHLEEVGGPVAHRTQTD